MKLSMNDLKNITPVGVNVLLHYEEEYSGESKDIELRVYPLTVKEKLEVQGLNDALAIANKVKEEDRTDEQIKNIIDLNEKINLQYALFAVRKTIPDVTIEFIKEKFPRIWYQTIFLATLEAEGITKADIEKEKN